MAKKLFRFNCCNTLNPKDFPLTGGLVLEHQLLERSLIKTGTSLQKSKPMDALRHVNDFYSLFRDGFFLAHFQKEEILFLSLLKHCKSSILPELLELLRDHREDRNELDLLKIDNKSNFLDIKEIFTELAEDIGRHAEIENFSVFKMAESELPRNIKERIALEMQAIGYLESS